jgi:Protein of unknown function (DUF1360)
MTTIEQRITDALAVHRLTRLVTRDTITRPLRAGMIAGAYARAYEPGSDWVQSERSWAEWDEVPLDDDDAPPMAAFITCRWCVSIWIAFGVVAARRYASWAWDPIARALALSSAAVLAAGLER